MPSASPYTDLSSKELPEVLLNAVDFIRSNSYFKNGDMIVVCTVLKEVAKTHAEAVAKPSVKSDHHLGEP